eukprot:3489586-Pyramimonas_sp.AAC.1
MVIGSLVELGVPDGLTVRPRGEILRQRGEIARLSGETEELRDLKLDRLWGGMQPLRDLARREPAPSAGGAGRLAGKGLGRQLEPGASRYLRVKNACVGCVTHGLRAMCIESR